MIGLSIKEVRDMLVHCPSWRVIHCFEGFWRDTIETRCLPLFQFVDDTFDFFEGNWSINGGKAWLLFNEVEY
jgi:hypothetical protein